MSIYAVIGGEQWVDLTNTHGYGALIEWIASLSDDYDMLLHLVEHGWIDELAQFRKQLQAAAQVSTPKGDVADIVTELLSLSDTAAETLVITDGLGQSSAEPSEKHLAGTEHDHDQSAHGRGGGAAVADAPDANPGTALSDSVQSLRKAWDTSSRVQSLTNELAEKRADSKAANAKALESSDTLRAMWQELGENPQTFVMVSSRRPSQLEGSELRDYQLAEMTARMAQEDAAAAIKELEDARSRSRALFVEMVGLPREDQTHLPAVFESDIFWRERGVHRSLGWGEAANRLDAQTDVDPANANAAIRYIEQFIPDHIPSDNWPVRLHNADWMARGKYVPGMDSTSGVSMPADSSVGAWLHEIGHHLEFQLHGLMDRAQAFLKYRIAQSDKRTVRFQEMFPDNNYRSEEEGNPDDFAKAFAHYDDGSTGGDADVVSQKILRDAHYAGKQYGVIWRKRPTEIIAMGVELLYNAPLEFAANDPEWCWFVVDALRRVQEDDGVLRLTSDKNE